jgi:hypothetical protein
VIHIEIAAENVEQLKVKFAEVAAFLQPVSVQVELPKEILVDELEADPAPSPAPKKAKKKPVEEPTDIGFDDDDSAPKKEDVIAALKKVNTDKGMPKAKALLSAYGCSRLGELKEDQYAAFIKDCKSA